MIVLSLLLGIETADAAPPRTLSLEETGVRERLMETFDAHFFPERVDDPSVVHQHGIREVSAKGAADSGCCCLTSLRMSRASLVLPSANWMAAA